MHYYQFNIGEYASHTRHLSPIEDIAYRRLLDLAYTTELPLPNDIRQLTRLTNLREYQQEVEDVLNEFWLLIDDGWVNNRVIKEIEKTGKKSEAAKNSAAIRWNNERKAKTMQTECEVNANASKNNANESKNDATNNPLPITHYPLPITHKKPSRKNALDDGFHEFWSVYPKKVGKADAEKKWIAKKPNIDKVLNALSWQIVSDQWNKNDGDFIPNPSTYINQERWNDEKPKIRAVF